MKFYSSYSIIAVVIFLARLVVGIVAGRLVCKDARQKERLAFSIPPFWWGIIVFAEPALGVLVYWVIHHSTLSRLEDNRDGELRRD